MNITPETIYWITRLDGLQTILTAVAVICVILTVVLLLEACIENKFKLFKYVKYTVSIGVLSTILALLVPSTDEVMVIYGLPKLVNSEIAQEVGGDIPELYKMSKELMKAHVDNVKKGE